MSSPSKLFDNFELDLSNLNPEDYTDPPFNILPGNPRTMQEALMLTDFGAMNDADFMNAFDPDANRGPTITETSAPAGGTARGPSPADILARTTHHPLLLTPESMEATTTSSNAGAGENGASDRSSQNEENGLSFGASESSSQSNTTATSGSEIASSNAPASDHDAEATLLSALAAYTHHTGDAKMKEGERVNKEDDGEKDPATKILKNIKKIPFPIPSGGLSDSQSNEEMFPESPLRRYSGNHRLTALPGHYQALGKVLVPSTSDAEQSELESDTGTDSEKDQKKLSTGVAKSRSESNEIKSLHAGEQMVVEGTENISASSENKLEVDEKSENDESESESNSESDESESESESESGSDESESESDKSEKESEIGSKTGSESERDSENGGEERESEKEMIAGQTAPASAKASDKASSNSDCDEEMDVDLPAAEARGKRADSVHSDLESDEEMEKGKGEVHEGETSDKELEVTQGKALKHTKSDYRVIKSSEFVVDSDGEPELDMEPENVNASPAKASAAVTQKGANARKAPKGKGTAKPRRKATNSSSSKEPKLDDIEEIEEALKDAIGNAMSPEPHRSEAHFLGYCMINIVLPFCGGHGCRITDFKTQRKVNHAHVRKFLEGAGDDGKGFRVREAENALKFALPRGSFDKDSLTKDPSEAATIVWMDGARDMEGIRLGGLHRTVAYKAYHAKRIEFVQRCNEGLARAEAENDLGKKAKILKIKEAFLAGCGESMNWMVMVYDLEGIVEDPERVAIEMKLTSNTTIETLPENENDALRQIFQFMAEIDDDNKYQDAIKHAASMLLNKYPHIQQLLRRGHSLVHLIAQLIRHASFSSFAINPKELADFNQYVWGMMEPVLKGCMHELTFLSTDLDLPEGISEDDEESLESPDTIRTISESLAQSLREHSPSNSPISELVFNCIVNASEALFVGLSLGDYDLGSNPKDYERLMNKYWSKLPGEVNRLINKSREEDEDQWDEYDSRVATILMRKLKVVVGRDYLVEADLAPRLPGPLPVLSPSLLHHLIQSWLELERVLFMISHWFCPGIRYVGSQLKGHSKYATSSPPFLSYTGAIVHALGYHLGHGLKLREGVSWEETSPSDMLNLQPLPDSDAMGFTFVRGAFHKIINVLFWKKDLLRDLESLLPFLPAPDAYSSSDKVSLPADEDKYITTHAFAIADAWVKVIKEEYSVRMENVTPRLSQQAPQDVQDYVRIYNKEGILQGVLHNLQLASVNFLVPSKINNRRHLNTQFLKQVLMERKFYKDELYPQAEAVDQLPWLFHKLRSEVRKLPGFAKFCLWPDMPLPKHKKVTPISTKLLASSERSKEMVKREAVLNKALTAFARALAREDCLGIPVEVEVKGKGKKKEEQPIQTKKVYQLHPSMEVPLHVAHLRAHSLLEEMADIQALPYPEMPEMPELPRTREAYWKANKVKFTMASKDALAEYYEVEEVKRAKEKVKAKADKRKRAEESGETSRKRAREGN